MSTVDGANIGRAFCEHHLLMRCSACSACSCCWLISTSPCESFLVPSPPRNSRPLTLYVPWSANGLDVLARHTYSHTEAAVSKA